MTDIQKPILIVPFEEHKDTSFLVEDYTKFQEKSSEINIFIDQSILCHRSFAETVKDYPHLLVRKHKKSKRRSEVPIVPSSSFDKLSLQNGVEKPASNITSKRRHSKSSHSQEEGDLNSTSTLTNMFLEIESIVTQDPVDIELLKKRIYILKKCVSLFYPIISGAPHIMDDKEKKELRSRSSSAGSTDASASLDHNLSFKRHHSHRKTHHFDESESDKDTSKLKKSHTVARKQKKGKASPERALPSYDKPPLLRRRTQSLLDIANPSEETKISSFIVKRVEKNADFGIEDTKKNISATLIQKWYRYYKARKNFIAYMSQFKPKPLITKGERRLIEDDWIIEFGVTKPIENAEMKKNLTLGIYLFNLKPEKGISQLISYGIIDETETSVAHFLYTCRRLNKNCVGDYLTLGNEFTNKVLQEFICMIDIKGLNFEKSLRKLLSESNFIIPGEAQKIDRVMLSFGKYFFEQFPGIFKSKDTPYVLSYSIIMLNTDAHNPKVKNKMTLKEFIQNNRKIDDGQDLPSEFLTQIYYSITQNEIKMKDTDQILLIQERLEGFDKTLVDPQRQLIAQYHVREIPDILSKNTYKHDRILYLFNDLILIAKPGKKKNEFRYLFNFLKMRIEQVKDNGWHSNVVELYNPYGLLVTMSFLTNESKVEFMKISEELTIETSFLSPERHETLRSLVAANIKRNQSMDASLSELSSTTRFFGFLTARSNFKKSRSRPTFDVFTTPDTSETDQSVIEKDYSAPTRTSNLSDESNTESVTNGSSVNNEGDSENDFRKHRRKRSVSVSQATSVLSN